MKFIFIMILLAGMWFNPALAEKWEGLDKDIDTYAADSGAVPGSVFHLEGDLPLFMFALAGTAAGFIMGYNWRRIFKEKEALIKKQGKTDDRDN